MTTIRINWDRNQRLIALKLYFELSFGQFHSKNNLIIEWAKIIGRTPSALAMKLSNFASLDSAIIASGRIGLSGASKSDKALWNEMLDNCGLFEQEIQRAMAFYTEQQSILEIPKTITAESSVIEYEGFTKTATVKVRRNQQLFRRCVLSNYNYQCCISGLAIPPLLLASHIVPWKEDSLNRLNPANGLCLSALHDKAFDLGFISLSDDLTVLVSPSLKTNQTDTFNTDALLAYEGKEILMPKQFIPDLAFLDYHRKNIYKVA